MARARRHKCKEIFKHTHENLFTYVNAYNCLHPSSQMHADIPICTYIHIYIYTDIHAQTFIYRRIYRTHMSDYRTVFLRKSSSALKVTLRHRALPAETRRFSVLECLRQLERNALTRWRHYKASVEYSRDH